MSDTPLAPLAAGLNSSMPPPQTQSGDLSRVMDVKVDLTVELGRRRLSIQEVLQLAPNSVLEFFKRSDEPLDIRVGGRLVARGEAVIMGERYGVRVTEVVSPKDALSQEGLLP